MRELLDYPSDSDRSQPVVLLQDNPEHSYLAQTGLIGGNYPTHKTVLQLQPGERTLQDGQDTLTVRLESPEMDGVKLVKTLTLRRGAYDIEARHEVINTSGQSINPTYLHRCAHMPMMAVMLFIRPPARRSTPIEQAPEGGVRIGRAANFGRRSTTATWPWCSTTLPAPGCWIRHRA